MRLTRPPAPPSRGRLFIYNTGFLRQRRLRRILTLAGWELHLGLPRRGRPQTTRTGPPEEAPRGQQGAAARDAPDRETGEAQPEGAGSGAGLSRARAGALDRSAAGLRQQAGAIGRGTGEEPGNKPGAPSGTSDAPDGARDRVAVWGRSPTSWRGERVARAREVPLLRVEDAFLRSVHPGRRGEPPLGLLLDRTGVHFDASTPSDLETLLARHPLDDPALLARAQAGIARLQAAHISKYNAFDPAASAPPGPYVLVVDQTRGDAALCGAGRPEFAALLARARADHPRARILLRSHPESIAGLRAGHFGTEDLAEGVTLCTTPLSPWRLLEGATAVYTHSSQLGFEAILAGLRPVVAGRPFYAGWGLSEDLGGPIPRRGRQLSAAQLFAAAMLLAPHWHDPFRDAPCSFERALDILEAQVRAWREDRFGYAAWGMRSWKRGSLQGFLGSVRPVRFASTPCRRRTPARIAAQGAALPPPDSAPAPEAGTSGPHTGHQPQSDRGNRVPVVWASRAGEAPPGALRMEDGFLRSRGLGADLVPPLSLVLDDLGIYYDPRHESRLERLIAASVTLPPRALARAEALRQALVGAGVSKYNLTGALPPLPAGHRILVPGQVEDDASILAGCGEIRTNLALLRAARKANPQAVLIYKPHPDVEAGLRPGRLETADALAHADLVAEHADIAALLAEVDEVWTLTSLTGLEALLRGRPVTCLGTPFYAGWGLTRDLGPPCPRRRARPTLAGLTYAALIAYPRYRDPVTGLPCPPEVAVERLADPHLPRGGPGLRALAKLQGWLAGHAWLWRRTR